ncbi:hypothetical protein [Streptomyces sp. NPDC050804]|uniref:hypothetical protein n=1 Tax=Streptomyces sp. NPDC050804 TaxID=3154745 RepID=UPI00342C743A
MPAHFERGALRFEFRARLPSEATAQQPLAAGTLAAHARVRLLALDWRVAP